MKFAYGKQKFVKKEIELIHPNDPKILLIFLFLTEHDWSYAMDI